MTGDSAREGELPEQPGHAERVPGHLRIGFAVRALEPDIRHQAGPSVARSGDEENLALPLSDDAIEMGVEQIESRRRPPMSQQARLDVLGPQRLPQQRVVHEVDLTDRQVVRGPPVRVEPRQLRRIQRRLGDHPHADSSRVAARRYSLRASQVERVLTLAWRYSPAPLRAIMTLLCAWWSSWDATAPRRTSPSPLPRWPTMTS